MPVAGFGLNGEAFDDGPRRHAELMPGMGKVHFAVSTSKPEAQEFIDQGVAYSSTKPNAVLREAAVIDLDSRDDVLGHGVGELQQRTPGLADFSRKQAKGDAKLTSREVTSSPSKGSFKEGASDKEHKQAFYDGLESIIQEFPGDIDVFYAWLAMATWQNGASGSRQAIDTHHRLGPRDRADVTWAHHYRIHPWDSNSCRAVRSAALYARTAPGSHTHGMPEHTGTRLAATPTPPTSKKARHGLITPT